MRSVFVDCHVFDGMFQGSRTYIKGLYLALIKQAPHVQFYFAAYDIATLRAEFGEFTNVSYLKYRSKNKFYRLIFDIPHLIRKYDIEWAHFQYILPLVKTCKEIVTIHDVLFIDFPQFFSFKFRVIYNFLFKIAAKRADKLLTVSEYSKERISFHYLIKKEFIGITNNAVTIIENTERLTDDNFILFVSRIEPRKNHITLLKAFVQSRLYERDVKLVFAGKQTATVPELDEYLFLLPVNIREKVIFCTPNNDELRDLFLHCSFFVYPSLAEGFGIPPLEAALYGKPVICSNTTAMSEFKDLGIIMFNPYDLNELTESLLKVYSLNRSACIDVNDISNKIRNKYDWNLSAKSYLNIIVSSESNN